MLELGFQGRSLVGREIYLGCIGKMRASFWAKIRMISCINIVQGIFFVNKNCSWTVLTEPKLLNRFHSFIFSERMIQGLQTAI